MRIGILTFHWACNYGAVLQAYALQQVLLGMGHTVKIINYRPDWAADNKRHRFPHSIGEMFGIIDFLVRRTKFNRFCKKYLLVTRTYYYREVIKDYDLVITGSDQVFNPDIIASTGTLDTTYLLEYVQSARKSSYAASFGNSALADKFKRQFHDFLTSFYRISVRENSGIKIVTSMGLHALSVPDPTVLYGNFQEIVREHRTRSPYVLNFIFQPSEKVSVVQNAIADKTQLKTMSIIGVKDYLKRKKGFISPSPGKWLSLIQHAEFVITDSFHCTVFCLLNHKPFIALCLDAWGEDWSERIKDLLHKLSLDDRLIAEPQVEDIISLYNKAIDWADVDRRLDKWRTLGKNYLKEILKEL